MTENRNNESLKPKPRKKNGYPLKRNIALAAVTVILTILVIYELFYTTRFSALSKEVFRRINIGMMLILIIIDLLVLLAIRTRKRFVRIAAALTLTVCTVAGGYAGWILTRVDKNLDNITDTVITEDVATSLVLYNGTSGSPIMSLKDLEGRKVGYTIETKNAEVGMHRLKNEGINVEYKEYLSYADTFTALIDGSVDCAILPKMYWSTLANDELLQPYIDDTTALETFSESITTKNDEGADKDLTKEPFTVLLSGENQGLADTIILFSVNPVSLRITMTSIARDSYVPITCYGGASSKINAAHASSEACLVKTVKKLTGIDIDYTVEFNFKSVIQVVDAVGGVDVDITHSFDAQCWDVNTDHLVVIRLEKGDNQHLDGQRALGFVRERHAFPGGDFARQQHQQEVITQIISKVMATRDPNTYVRILDAAGDNIKTNMSTDQVVNFIAYAMGKAKRYYNPTNVAGVFDIVNSRIYGYNSSLWNESLKMDLYIYRLFKGSIKANADFIQRNLMEDDKEAVPEAVKWTAADTYTPPAVSRSWYNEPQTQRQGRPSATPDSSDDAKPTARPTAKPTASPPADTKPSPSASAEPTPKTSSKPSESEEPAPDTSPEPTKETTPEPTSEATPEPTKETTPEPTKEATPEPTKEATPEPTKEATPEPTKETKPEPTKETKPDPTPTPESDPTPEG
ncbi:MAG: LCP family protein [Solobacterium sp.]|nr:LCP family protein [Solobacterium sp.]